MILGITIIGVIIYIILTIVCLRRERHREEERRLRREQQNRDWQEQFNQLSPSIRAAIRMMREDQREAAQVIALLHHLQINPRRRKNHEKIDWKKEGF